MADLFPATLVDQIGGIRREIEMRARAYPRFVSRGTMTQAKADREMVLIRAVLATLEKLNGRP